jgi:hypothetical protein
MQDFLLKHTGVQTYERAVRRRDEEFKKWNDIFVDVSVEFMDDFYTEMYLLKEKINKEMKHID